MTISRYTILAVILVGFTLFAYLNSKSRLRTTFPVRHANVERAETDEAKSVDVTQPDIQVIVASGTIDSTENPGTAHVPRLIAAMLGGVIKNDTSKQPAKEDDHLHELCDEEIELSESAPANDLGEQVTQLVPAKALESDEITAIEQSDEIKVIEQTDEITVIEQSEEAGSCELNSVLLAEATEVAQTDGEKESPDAKTELTEKESADAKKLPTEKMPFDKVNEVGPIKFSPITELSVDIREHSDQAPEDKSVNFVGGQINYAMQRDWGHWVSEWEAPNLFYNPLYFQDVTLERYGQTLGPYNQVLRSTGMFLGSAALLPLNAMRVRPRSYVTPLGYERPGDCVPFTFERFGR